jgi:YgiT-type zinc finger domain-containing protein
VRPGRVTVDLRRGSTLVVVEKVPADVCQKCGARYFSGDVVDKLQKVFAKRARARRKVKVPIVKFEAVA